MRPRKNIRPLGAAQRGGPGRAQAAPDMRQHCGHGPLCQSEGMCTIAHRTLTQLTRRRGGEVFPPLVAGPARTARHPPHIVGYADGQRRVRCIASRSTVHSCHRSSVRGARRLGRQTSRPWIGAMSTCAFRSNCHPAANASSVGRGIAIDGLRASCRAHQEASSSGVPAPPRAGVPNCAPLEVLNQAAHVVGLSAICSAYLMSSGRRAAWPAGREREGPTISCSWHHQVLESPPIQLLQSCLHELLREVVVPVRSLLRTPRAQPCLSKVHIDLRIELLHAPLCRIRRGAARSGAPRRRLFECLRIRADRALSVCTVLSKRRHVDGPRRVVQQDGVRPQSSRRHEDEASALPEQPASVTASRSAVDRHGGRVDERGPSAPPN